MRCSSALCSAYSGQVPRNQASPTSASWTSSNARGRWGRLRRTHRYRPNASAGIAGTRMTGLIIPRKSDTGWIAPTDWPGSDASIRR